MSKFLRSLYVLSFIFFSLWVIADVNAAPADGWKTSDWVIKDDVNEIERGEFDLCNVFFREAGGKLYLKATTRFPITEEVLIKLTVEDQKGVRQQFVSGSSVCDWDIYRGVCEMTASVPSAWSGSEKLTVELVDSRTSQVCDAGSVVMSSRQSLDNEAGNCAFVHHGNQGLTYTSVFRGDGGSGDEGFDEILELHDGLNAPGNFHMSGTLITAAEYYDPDFNQWLRDGITEGWVGMLTSAYAQHIMPFVDDSMNNWAVHVEYNMVQTFYGYSPRVAWIPERVWLASGHYPDAHLNDAWLGDNWEHHGVDAVILDDWPHCSGYSDRKIHWMNNGSGITLRVIPIDGDFTGNCHYNPGAAIAQIQGTGQYQIIVYGTDWEAAAEMADFNCPDCLENYSQVVQWASDNAPGVGIWKLDAALDNPDFNGTGIEVGNGTYGLIGGTDGYGGSDNSWYGDWAGTASHSDFHSPSAWDYGTIWTQTHSNIMASPSNNLSESAWYVMMTNLHETGWHDYMGGPVSGWIHRYSSHIKNANVYTEAAHWAAGEYLIDVNAYLSDIDIDGVDELVIHNDRVMAVFESVGGRAQWIFAKGPSGYNYSIVGSCNTYWAETDGDYDEPGSNNHQAAFADVGPHYRNELYSMSVDEITNTTAVVHFTHNEITKTISIELGQTYLRADYEVGSQDCYIRHGFTPDLVAQIWNPEFERIWSPDADYCGFRNPNTQAAGALVIGNGGANHQLDFIGTLVHGDELRGYDRFTYLLFAGETSDPDGEGRIAELETLAAMNLDEYPPRLNDPAVFILGNTIELSFSEAVEETSAENPANWSLQDFTGTYTVTAAERQGDWRRVRLTVSPNLQGGDNGNVVVSGVTDLIGNPVDPTANTASLTVPTGATPHTIIIDGTIDFDRSSEILYAGVDTLTITWDADALYIGYWNCDLNTADFFVNIDTDQVPGSGASTGSWGRVSFTDPHLIEYQIANEGGLSAIQLNHWNGTSWDYPGSGTVTTYNGWADVPYTETRIPWSELGNPTGIALSVHLTEEDTQVTQLSYPPSNPTGNQATLPDVYRIYQPYISGDMPLFGAEPRYILTADLTAPQDVVIYDDGGVRHLSWTAVEGAAEYEIYRAETSDGTFELIDQTDAPAYEDDDALTGTVVFYEIRARAGI